MKVPQLRKKPETEILSQHRFGKMTIAGYIRKDILDVLKDKNKLDPRGQRIFNPGK